MEFIILQLNAIYATHDQVAILHNIMVYVYSPENIQSIIMVTYSYRHIAAWIVKITEYILCMVQRMYYLILF